MVKSPQYLDGGLVEDIAKELELDPTVAAAAVAMTLLDITQRLKRVAEVSDFKDDVLAVVKLTKAHALAVCEKYGEETMKKARNFEKEYNEYHAKPEQKRRRAQRNAARAKAMKEGRVEKGDGKEVDHVNAPRTGSLENVPTRVVSKKVNRSRQPKRKG